jgi:hypothetical protein
MPRFAAAILLVLTAAMLTGCFGGSRPAPVTYSPAQCLADLNSHVVTYHPVDFDEQNDSQCRVETAVRVSRIEVAFNHPATMSCRLAARIDAFERMTVQRLALEDLGHPVTRIDHLGAYSCRTSTGNHDQLSEHAFGLAIDISAFKLSDGTIISVEHDWSPPGRKSDFLHHLAHSACQYFSMVLTPDSNSDHFNHMHLDIGPNRLCSV